MLAGATIAHFQNADRAPTGGGPALRRSHGCRFPAAPGPRQGGVIRQLLRADTAQRNARSNDMAGYKLATYQSADGPRAGLVIDDKVYDAAKLSRNAAYASVLR